MHSDTAYRPIESLFHTFAEFRPIVNRVVALQSTDWMVANAQVSPNVSQEKIVSMPIHVNFED